jgi:hypothetical protein
VFENKVLRIIFEPEGQEVTGRLSKLYNEKFHKLYISILLELSKGEQEGRSIQALYERER